MADPVYSHRTVFRDATGALFRHKRKALGVFLAILVPVALWNIFASNVYRSESKLLVRLGRENAGMDPTATLGHEQVMTVPPSRENEINSIVEVLNSRAIAEKTVDALGPAAILSPGAAAGDRSEAASPSVREQAIRRLTRRLKVASIPRSNVLCLTYDAEGPEVARDHLGKLIDVFLEEYVLLHRPAGVQKFLADQAARLRQDLEHREDDLRKLKGETGLAVPEDRGKAVMARIVELENDLLKTKAEWSEASSSAQHLRAKSASLPKTEVSAQTAVAGNEGADLMRDRLYGLQVVAAEAKAMYAEDHPKLHQVIEQVSAAREILGAEEKSRQQWTTAPAKSFEQAASALLLDERMMAAKQGRSDVLQGQLVNARRELTEFNDRQVRVARLQREKEIQESYYRKYAAVLEEARLDEALKSERLSNIGVIQAASLEPEPASPKRLLNLLLGVAAGLLGALAAAVLAEYFDHSFLTPEDVQGRLRLPLLAVVPSVPSRDGHPDVLGGTHGPNPVPDA